MGALKRRSPDTNRRGHCIVAAARSSSALLYEWYRVYHAPATRRGQNQIGHRLWIFNGLGYCESIGTKLKLYPLLKPSLTEWTGYEFKGVKPYA